MEIKKEIYDRIVRCGLPTDIKITDVKEIFNWLCSIGYHFMKPYKDKTDGKYYSGDSGASIWFDDGTGYIKSTFCFVPYPGGGADSEEDAMIETINTYVRDFGNQKAIIKNLK